MRFPAIRFLFGIVLGRPATAEDIPRPKRDRKLPAVLDHDRTVRLVSALRNPKFLLAGPIWLVERVGAIFGRRAP